MAKKKKTVFSTPWFSLESLEDPEHGMTAEDPYYRIVEADGIIVLALTPDEQIILVRQFRPVLGEYTIELPAGGIGHGESPVQAAEREFYEETGYRAGELIQMSDAMPLLASRSTMKGYAILAKDVVRDPSFESKENIEVMEVSQDALRTMVSENRFLQFAGLGVLLRWLWSR